ncbi:MAG: VWA domain-containing protein, partial [Frankiaceae bacterium]|nr:VWA domain-containing protein [Frankiaceae bacterium]
DIARYDRVFAAVFDGTDVVRYDDAAAEPALRVVPPLALPGDAETDGTADGARAAAASRAELLRRKDFADLQPADREAALALLTPLSLVGETRRHRRTRPAGHGPVDRHRTLRRTLRAGGEPVAPSSLRRRQRPRRVVLLVDISGSMAPYADAFVRFAHVTRRARGPRTEVFTLGTRLTRVTRELSHRDPDLATAAVAAAVPDWSGGTRLGELVKAFLDTWGRRGMARGAVVVVMSDGWERGDATLMGEQMRLLRRLAHRVVWANPRAGRPGFAPLAAGMAAALPSVDDLVAGNSVDALQKLARTVVGAHA